MGSTVGDGWQLDDTTHSQMLMLPSFSLPNLTSLCRFPKSIPYLPGLNMVLEPRGRTRVTSVAEGSSSAIHPVDGACWNRIGFRHVMGEASRFTTPQYGRRTSLGWQAR